MADTVLDRGQSDRVLAHLGLRACLECGQLQSGFARVWCPGCRMADTAAWLVDRVFPDVPVRLRCATAWLSLGRAHAASTC